ncbi:MAG: TfuA-like protein [Caulobacteraceae bacterium]
MSDEVTDRIAVFAGPTLARDARPVDPLLVWLPPAKAGDAFALVEQRPRAVVLIDGLFDGVPAIRHKEILCLLACGVPVIGGASMGALRAAELHTFGMIGAGRIFEAFACGRLVGDDEVAVLHGPAEWDWKPLTESLVNVRATIQSAMRARVLDAEAARRSLATAAPMFYKNRTWPLLLDALSEGGSFRSGQVGRFREWLEFGRVDLKQRDALSCLDVALGLDPSARTRRRFPPPTLFAAELKARALAAAGSHSMPVAPP